MAQYQQLKANSMNMMPLEHPNLSGYLKINRDNERCTLPQCPQMRTVRLVAELRENSVMGKGHHWKAVEGSLGTQLNTAVGAVSMWMTWIHGYSGHMDAWMQWLYGCIGYMDAVDTWMLWIRGCSGYVDAVLPWMQWIHGCVDTVDTWIQ